MRNMLHSLELISIMIRDPDQSAIGIQRLFLWLREIIVMIFRSDSTLSIFMSSILDNRNCKGKRCKLTVEPGPASCAIHSLEADYRPENATRKDSCGFASDYSFSNASTSVPNSENGNCFYGLPSEVQYKSNMSCVDGRAKFMTELIFPSPFVEKYVCMHNILCSGTKYRSNFVCYSHDASKEGEENTGYNSKCQYLLILVSGMFAWLFLWY